MSIPGTAEAAGGESLAISHREEEDLDEPSADENVESQRHLERIDLSADSRYDRGRNL
jgi:hypothetical protein